MNSQEDRVAIIAIHGVADPETQRHCPAHLRFIAETQARPASLTRRSTKPTFASRSARLSSTECLQGGNRHLPMPFAWMREHAA